MSADLPPMTLEDAQRIYDRPAYVQSKSGEPGIIVEDSDQQSSQSEIIAKQRNEAQRARARALFESAMKVGINAGMAHQLKNIRSSITRREREMDTIYDFGYMMIQDRVVPPIITEARDVYTQEGESTLRLSGAFYKIERQARFSSVAPNWREYLSFPIPVIDENMILGLILPKSPGEKVLWQTVVKDGWAQGIEQANHMLVGGLDRLNRDFMGMMRFHTFVLQGKITMPTIASEDIAVTKSGATMVLDETLLKITVTPDFNTDIPSHRSWVVTSTPLLPLDHPRNIPRTPAGEHRP